MVHKNSTKKQAPKEKKPENKKYMERRSDIRQLLITLGRENLNVTNLSSRYDVSRKTIYKDIERILDNIPDEELERERSKMYHDFLGYDMHLGRLITENRNNPEFLLKAIETASRVKMRKGKVFEMFGLKEKVAEPIRFEMIVEDYTEEEEDEDEEDEEVEEE